MAYDISASILSADFAKLGEEVKAVLEAGATRIHLDIMDNHYVPNLSFGPLVCQSLRRFGISAPFDVHLMTEPVDDLIPQFAKAGASSIVFHPEAVSHVDRTLQLIKDCGCEAGLAINPATSLECLTHVLKKLDRVLVMSVNPGFGGQLFIPHAIEKVKRIRATLDQEPRPICLEVDGGIKAENIGHLIHAGANSVVVGSWIFEQPSYEQAIWQLHQGVSSDR